MTTKMTQKIGCLILCLLIVLALLPSQVFAAEAIDLAQDVTLSIKYQDTSASLVGAEFSIYRVADVDPNEIAGFTLTGGFEDSQVSVDNLDSSGWRNAANLLTSFVQIYELPALDSGVTDAEGSLTFPCNQGIAMKPGLYLVIGQKHTQDDTLFTAEPFLVALPALNEADNVWDYHTTVTPKITAKPIEPDITVDRKVIKVWEDEGFAHNRPEQVTVVLLCDGAVFDTAILREANEWTHRWEGLDGACAWTIAELDAPNGYSVSIRQEGITFVITNTYQPKIDVVAKEVIKVWDDNNAATKRPASIVVELLADDEVYDAVTLNDANFWRYRWEELDASCEWSVREREVPEGYVATKTQNRTTFVISNTLANMADTTTMQVLKLWDDEGHEENRPEQITVELLENGQVHDTVELNAENIWRYEWTGLSKASEWSVRETAVPAHYTASTQVNGNVTIITNTYAAPDAPAEPVDRRVLKVWKDEGHRSERPAQIQAALLCNGKVHEVVTLNAAGNWAYQWNDLDGSKEWTVREYTELDKYTSSVTRDGDLFIITNTYSEIPRTGQLWWPVPMLFAVGLGMILIGLLRRRGVRYEE